MKNSEELSSENPQPQAEHKVAWRCTVCDYIYEGDPLPEDYECPICGVGPELFEKI